MLVVSTSRFAAVPEGVAEGRGRLKEEARGPRERDRRIVCVTAF